MPRVTSVETAIEFTHRFTSGLAGVLAILLVVWAFRAAPRGQGVRFAAMGALFFMVTEGLIGAALVKFELVAGDTSPVRAWVVGLHLLNTLLLTGAMTLTALAAGGRQLRWVPRDRLSGLACLGALSLLVVSMLGAVTALGDTLFPVPEGELAFTATYAQEHFLLRWRAVHPVVATLASVLVVCTASRARTLRPELSRSAKWVIWLTVTQVLFGFVNVALSAPGWMQIVHLALSNLLWVAFIVLGAGCLSTNESVARERLGAVLTSPPAHS